MQLSTNLTFNTKVPDIMHIDINSCFATIEQQANPKLRGKVIAVVARTTESGCILAASIEAKKLGIKTGMRVFEARHIYRNIITLPTDPEKYRYVHRSLKKLLLRYSPNVVSKSIDEFVMDFSNTPGFEKGLLNLAQDIKQDINNEIGEWIKVSIGIGPNQFLAKTAAGLHKPDGLDIIDQYTYHKVYPNLMLRDLCGIGSKNEIRLKAGGIFTVEQFYNAGYTQLKSVFKSVNAHHWYLRLRGWETDVYQTHRSSFNHSYVLPKGIRKNTEVLPMIQKIVEKLGYRLREKGYTSNAINLALVFEQTSPSADKKHFYWDNSVNLPNEMTSSVDMFKQVSKIYEKCPYLGYPIRQISVTCFYLNRKDQYQLEIFSDIKKKKDFTNSIDKINSKWGQFTLKPALMVDTAKEVAPDSIAFGRNMI